MKEFFSDIFSYIAGILQEVRILDIVDVVIVAFILYQLLLWARETRAKQVLKGVGIILVAYWISDMLELMVINWLLTFVVEAGAIVLVVLFQPELRRALEQIGRRTGLEKGVLHLNEISEYDAMIEEIIRALTNLSRRKVGALLVIERQTGLGEIIATGTTLDSAVSSGLLENIFEPNTPLHDGAVVLRGNRLAAAGCILTLIEDDSMLSRELGTRHRAALGVTESTDAMSLIVSEETGIISMARSGKLTRHLDAVALRSLLSEIYTVPRTETGFMPKLRKWVSRHEK